MSLYAIIKSVSPLTKIWADRRLPIASVKPVRNAGDPNLYLWLDPDRCTEDEIRQLAIQACEECEQRKIGTVSVQLMADWITTDSMFLNCKNFEEIEQAIPSVLTFPSYAQQLGHWMRDESGTLACAVATHMHHTLAPDCYPKPGKAQISAIRQYLQYWADFPGWNGWGMEDPSLLQDLRVRAESLSSAQEIDQWLRAALDLGIDPI